MFAGLLSCCSILTYPNKFNTVDIVLPRELADCGACTVDGPEDPVVDVAVVLDEATEAVWPDETSIGALAPAGLTPD